MKISDLVPLWITAPATTEALSKNAVDTYSVYIRHFSRWMGTEASAGDATPDRLRAYFKHLQAERDAGGCEYRPRTVRVAWRSVGAFVAWLVEEGHLPENPMPKVKMPRLDDAVRELVTQTEAAACCLAYLRIAHPLRSALARVVVQVLTATCVRNFELRGFDLADLDLRRAQLTVRHGKGDRRRVVPLKDDALIAMREWLKARPADCKHNGLFCLGKGRRLGPAGLMTLLREVAAIAGYKGATNIKPHSLRHFGATAFYHRTRNLHAVMVLLGHSNLSTTQLYLHTSNEVLHELRNFTGVDSPSPAYPATDIPTALPGDVQVDHLPPQRFKQ